ncbi:34924_t:CDS:2, partial [Gigaspora margarita]
AIVKNRMSKIDEDELVNKESVCSKDKENENIMEVDMGNAKMDMDGDMDDDMDDDMNDDIDNNMDNDMAYDEYLTDKEYDGTVHSILSYQTAYCKPFFETSISIELDQKYAKESIAFSRQEYKNYSKLSINYKK